MMSYVYMLNINQDFLTCINSLRAVEQDGIVQDIPTKTSPFQT